MRGKHSKWLWTVFLCGAAMFCAFGARAQSGPVARDVLLSRDARGASGGSWEGFAARNRSAREPAGPGEAESGAAWLLVLAPGASGPGLNFTLSAAAAVDNGLRTTPEPGTLALVGSALLLIGMVLRKKIPGAES